MLQFKFWLLAILLLISGNRVAVARPERPVKQYTRVQGGFLMVLRQGENLFEALEQLAIKEKLPAASISGMGFVNIKFGYYNKATKDYDPKEFYDMELASMSGSVAWKDGKPSLHLHGVVADKDFHAFGGHILDATVSTGSLEVLITVHPVRLQRSFEDPPGANVLQIK